MHNRQSKTTPLSLGLRAVVAWTVAAGFAAASTEEVRSSRPFNVVFILVDDLGWSDLGCFGSDFYKTPAIDRLARQSLKFTQAYAAAPVCSPTRAAILTGKSPARLDLTIWHEGAVDGGPVDRPLRNARSKPNLPREEVTLAELFRQAGYATAHIGKWHLGTAAYYPETQGFDINIGGTFWGAPSTFFAPFSGRWNERDPETRYVPGLHRSRADYLPDALTDEAINVIEDYADRPFFLNLWYYTVHSPIQAPAELVTSNRARGAGRRHRDPTYAAMVQRMDHNVGRVLKKLVELDLMERTIVIFTSDNGGVDFPQRGITPTSNAPLRSGKGTLYEGGLRVPLLVDWPNHPAGETDNATTSQDFFPTLMTMLKKQAPDRFESTANRLLDGVDLTRVIEEPTYQLAARPLYWHFPHYYPRMTPGSAIRDGKWKLIHRYEDDQVELYDLTLDPGEQRNVMGDNKKVAQALRQRLDEWRSSVDAQRPTNNSIQH